MADFSNLNAQLVRDFLSEIASGIRAAEENNDRMFTKRVQFAGREYKIRVNMLHYPQNIYIDLIWRNR